MSRTRHYWYGTVKKMITLYPVYKDEDTWQAYLFKKAISEATMETLKLPNGELRMQAVDCILIKKNKDYIAVGKDVNYDWRTVQNWITSFVNLTGKKAGF